MKRLSSMSSFVGAVSGSHSTAQTRQSLQLVFAIADALLDFFNLRKTGLSKHDSGLHRQPEIPLLVALNSG